MRAAAIALTLLVVLAGCGAGGSPTATLTSTSTPSPTDPATSTETPTATPSPTATPTPEDPRDAYPDDPDEDVVGWEQGYWYDEPIDVDNSDGLTDAEFEQVKARAMARVEYIRGREFRVEELQYQFMTREQLREKNLFEFPESDWRDQYWEAAFVVPENESSAEALTRLYSVVVDGYQYRNTVAAVVENPEQPRIDPLVLAHELSHALDWPPRRGGPTAPFTKDERLAMTAEEEGQASWVDARYEQLCRTEWECIQRPDDAGSVPSQDVNMGLYLQFAAPYTLGETLVQRQFEQDGREGVKHLEAYPPSSMEQVIHPETYESDQPVRVTVDDRTAGGWERLQRGRGPARDTFGEAVLYTMLWQNGVIETEPVAVTMDQQTGLNYTHPATAGWEGDVFVPFTNGSARGYVFRSVWETERDAEQFLAAYRELLRNRGAERVGEHTWVIESGAYADAFRVVRQGDTLVVVNAPTVAALADVHAVNESA